MNEQKENLAEEVCSDARRESCLTPEAYCDTSRIGDVDEQYGSVGIEPAGRDFELKWVFGEYGAGQAVSEIAKELGKSEGYVYARMRRKPEKYEDVKQIREENHNVRIRRIRGLADKLVLDYLEGLAADDKEAGEDIDRVNRIAKDYAHRVQLAEGMATENVGVGAMPFNVIITKTYETPATEDTEESEETTDETDEQE